MLILVEYYIKTHFDLFNFYHYGGFDKITGLIISNFNSTVFISV